MRLLIVLIAFMCASTAQAAKLAFVLGNASYQELADLQNTHADARAYADTFGDLGYDIIFHRDLGLDATLAALDDFLARVSAGDEVVVVYSGHGWSDGSTNYLVPTDAPKQGSDRLHKRRSIVLRNGLNGILDELEAAGVSLTVAIIDACRDNPFAPTAGTRSTGISRGLAPVKAASGSFVIYSAGEGQQALDRLPDDPPGAQLSVFTRTFLPHLKSGVALERAISAAQVETAALARKVGGHLQHPAYYDQTLGDTCLAGSCRATPANLPIRDSQCDALFEKASATEACFAFEAYSDVCPDHIFLPMASAFLARNCKAVSQTAKLAPKPGNEAVREDAEALWQRAEELREGPMEHGHNFSDVRKAYSFYKRAAEKGHAASQHMMGVFHQSGIAKFDVSFVGNAYTARDWFVKAAEQDYARSHVELADMYSRGTIATPRSLQIVGNHYLRALQLGDRLVIARAPYLKKEPAARIQKFLRQKGYYKGPIDGDLGLSSVAAMEKLLAERPRK